MQQKKPSTIHHPPSTSKTILLVGGGTGGHIFPLYPLAEKLLSEGHTVHLVVNDAVLDRQIISQTFSKLQAPSSKFKAHYLRTYKIDYHLSFRNLVAPFKILGSFLRTKNLLKKTKPDVVFFKGGFVGFPILVILKYFKFLNHLPFTINYQPRVYLHDSDISAGKLTQLIGKNADHVFTNFGPNATPLFYWPKSNSAPQSEASTPPLPLGEAQGQDSDARKVRTSANTQKNKSGLKRILVFGGSQGAQFLNNLMVQNIEELTEKYDITLVAGPKNTINHQPSTINPENFVIHSFLPQDDLIKAMVESDLVICRSGASMFQVLAAQTPCIAIPLPTSARNHQYDNAKYFADKGLGYLLEQNNQTRGQLLPTINKILQDKKLAQRLDAYQGQPQVEKITNLITK